MLTEPKPTAALTVWAWALAASAIVVLPLALLSFILGVVLAAKDEPGHGVGVMLVSLLGPPLFWWYVMHTM